MTMPRTVVFDNKLDEAADLNYAQQSAEAAAEALTNAVSCETKEGLLANLDEAKSALEAALAEVEQALAIPPEDEP